MAAAADSSEELTGTLARLARARAFPKTICPSEVARLLSSACIADMGVETWRDAMPIVREAVFQQVQCGNLEILQKGEVKNVGSLNELKGPIRFRKCQPGPANDTVKESER